MSHKFNGKDLPDWFTKKMIENYGEADHNAVVGLLVEDYIERNKPFEPPQIGTDAYFERYAVDIRAGIKFHNHDLDRWDIPTSEQEIEYFKWRDRKGLRRL